MLSSFCRESRDFTFFDAQSNRLTLAILNNFRDGSYLLRTTSGLGQKEKQEFKFSQLLGS